MKSRREWIYPIVVLAIGGIVLTAGLLYRFSAGKAEPSEKENSAVTTAIDLFAGITVSIDGVYPKLNDIVITADENDGLSSRLNFSIRISDMMPDGAHVTLKADTSAIEDFLTDNHYTASSDVNQYDIDPSSITSYLLSAKQLTSSVQKELLTKAKSFTESSFYMAGFAVLPESSTIFPNTMNENAAYTGVYGSIFALFWEESGFQLVFLSPILSPDGMIEYEESHTTYYSTKDAAEAAVRDYAAQNHLETILLEETI